MLNNLDICIEERLHQTESPLRAANGSTPNDKDAQNWPCHLVNVGIKKDRYIIMNMQPTNF